MTNEQNTDKKNKELETTVEVSYTDRTPINTGELRDVPLPDRYHDAGEISVENKEHGYIDTAMFRIDSYEHIPFGLEELRNMYNENGGNVDEILDQIKKYVKDIENDPLAMQYFMGNLCRTLDDLYQKADGYKEIGKNTKEILTQILSVPEGEKLNGFVCMNIAEFGMRLLDDCGIEAVVMSGLDMSEGRHAVLLFKSGDGKYTFVNYGTVEEISAPSIKEAINTIQKTSKSVIPDGFISLVDEKGAYKEYAFKDEALWGEELDKRYYNSDSPFDRTYADKSKLDVKVGASSQNDVSVTVDYTKVDIDDGKIRNLTLSTGYKKSNKTALFDSSQSGGIKIDYKGKNVGDKHNTYFEVKGVADYITGNQNGRDVVTNFYSEESVLKSMEPAIAKLRDWGYTEEEISLGVQNAFSEMSLTNQKYVSDQKLDYITGFLRGVYGIEHNFNISENSTLTNAAQGSLMYESTMTTSSFDTAANDFRVGLEDGIQWAYNNGKTNLSTSASGGIVMDFRPTVGAQIPTVQFGEKVNAGSVFSTQISDNLSMGASVSGYSVFTNPSTDYGATANTFVSYSPESNTVFRGDAGLNLEYQRLHIGGFNEMTENNKNFNVSVSAQHKDNTFYVGYNGKIDNINNTRNQSTFNVGYRKTF